MDGFWTGRGAPALVDWCEPNYAVTPWIAEWWNSLSSVGMVVVALIGLRAHAGGVVRAGMAGLAVIGVGSTLFHATLLRAAQAADELPMVGLGLLCAWALATRDGSRGGALAAVLAAFGAVFTLAYASVPRAFPLFLAVYGAVIAWVVVRTVQITRAGAAGLRRAAAVTLAAYVGGFALFWLPEHVLLPCEHPLQALPLHALWHLGAGVGTAAWWSWVAVDRAREGVVAAREVGG